MDYAGKSIAEVILSSNTPEPSTRPRVYHILNPDTTTSWNTLLLHLKAANLEFEIVDVGEWLASLERVAEGAEVKENPVIKLLVSHSLPTFAVL